jgi:hypothetical protein
MFCGQLMISSRIIRCFAANLRSPVVLSFDNLGQTYDLQSSCHLILCGQLMISSRTVIWSFATNLCSPIVLSNMRTSCYQRMHWKSLIPFTVCPLDPVAQILYDVRMQLYIITWTKNTTSFIEYFLLLSCSKSCPSFCTTRMFITLLSRTRLWPLF